MNTEELKILIEGSLDSIMSVNEFAEKIGIRAVELDNQFMKLEGMTVAMYTRSRRIERIKKLLATTSKKASAIAGETGYANESSACRAFKKVTRMTMTEYRTCNQTFPK